MKKNFNLKLIAVVISFIFGLHSHAQYHSIDDEKYGLVCSSLNSVGYIGVGDCSMQLRSMMYLHRLAGMEETLCIHFNMTLAEQDSISDILKAYLDKEYQNIICIGETWNYERDEPEEIYVAFLERVVDLDYQELAYEMVHYYHTIDWTSYTNKMTGLNIMEYIQTQYDWYKADWEIERVYADGQSFEEYYSLELNSLKCFENIFSGKYRESSAGCECKDLSECE